MLSIAHRRRTADRGLAAVTGTPTGRDDAELALTPAQQEYLTVHGFGPAAAHADFTDPEVRSHFVQLLRECGALAPSPVAQLPTSTHGRQRRHLRRAG